MFLTLIGSLLGGIFRLAPEVLKLFTQKSDNSHELAMVQAEMEFAKVRGEIAMRQTEAVMTTAEMDAMKFAFQEQSETSKAGGWLVAAISALVRPLVTYAFVIFYFTVKICAYTIALKQGGEWKEVLVSMWNDDDMAVLSMILTFWFVGRVYERQNAK